MLTRGRSARARGQELLRCLSTNTGAPSGSPPQGGGCGLKRTSWMLTGDGALPHSATGSFAKTTASRANLRAAGWTDEDFDKPVVTVGSPWSNALPCNNHLRELTDEVCAAVERHGGRPNGRPLANWGDRACLILCVRGETHQNARLQPNVAPVRPPIGNATSRGQTPRRPHTRQEA